MENMISISKDFQYSVNIGYDLNDNNKIKNFIPTTAAIELIEKIMLSTDDNSTNRARVLIGAYGKGKSHLVLVMLGLLAHKDRRCFSALLDSIKKYNTDLYQYIICYLESDKKLLPVVIDGNNMSMSQSFMQALQRTLSENDLLDIMPETNFEAAVDTIEKWKTEYPVVYNQLTTAISVPMKDFVISLKNYSLNSYNEFLTIYPTLTAGSSFNPFATLNVVDFYEKTSKAIKNKGYNGLYVIYDEFSKFLEANITTASITDIKMLQDFAEKCNRSGKEQLHLMLISHKEISNYIDKLPKQKLDGWRGVSERFEHVILQSSFEQMYNVITHVIKKGTDKWTDFLRDHQKQFDRISSLYKSEKMFEDINEFDVLVKEIYPLHPVSMYILPRMSEKVAQNERTLFTFLAGEGSGTLRNYIEQSENDFSLITPDIIYDYFAPQLRKEAYTTELHTLYKLTSNILSNISKDGLKAKIVKTIALCYALEQFEVFRPTLEELGKIYSCQYEIEEIEVAVNELISKHYIVYLKRSNSFLKLKETTGVDIEKEIHDCKEKIKNKISDVEILNRSNYNGYIYPTRYNDSFEITRYFDFQFITYKELIREGYLSSALEDLKADGIVYGVVPDVNDDLKEIRSKVFVLSETCNRVVFVIPKSVYDIGDELLEFEAVSRMKDAAGFDQALAEEYEMIYDDLHEIINSYIQEYLYPSSNKMEYIYQNETQKINRKAQLTRLLSVICERVYNKTPIINNEVINKNEISTVASNSRMKIIQGLLRSELENNLGLTGNGQEISIMRSVLILPGILKEKEDGLSIDLEPEDPKLRGVMSEIVSFFEDAKNETEKSFSELYTKLMAAEYGYGIRKGVIPIYLSAVLHEYKQYVVIKDKLSNIKLTAAVINQIDENPNEFSVVVENWNEEKTKFISKLEKVFSEYVLINEKTDNNFSYVVSAIKRWYLSLPKYTKEMEAVYENGNFSKIEKSKLKFLRLLKQPLISDQELLFEKLPKCFGYQEFTISVIDNVIATKEFYDTAIVNLQSELITEMRLMFGEQDKLESLTSIIRNWIEKLDKKVDTHLFANGAEKCFRILNDITNDEQLFICRLAKGITGLRIDDWNKTVITKFLENLKVYKDTLEQYSSGKKVADTVVDDTSVNHNEYTVTFINDDGTASIKHFEKVDISKRAKLLLNDIETSIDEMGHSISEQEKRQVIIEVLKKLC